MGVVILLPLDLGDQGVVRLEAQPAAPRLPLLDRGRAVPVAAQVTAIAIGERRQAGARAKIQPERRVEIVLLRKG